MTTETKEGTELVAQTEVEQKALTVPEQAEVFAVTTNDEYSRADEYLALWKSLEDEIHKDHDVVIKGLNDGHKKAIALRDKYLTPINTGRKLLKGKMIVYQDAQERIRRVAQAKAEAEARKRAEDEQLALAAQLEKEGDTETAEAVLAEPITPPPVVVPRTAPAASRLSAGRSVWSAEVVNLMALVKAVAEGKQRITLIQANETALNGMARSLKSGLAIPGVRAVERKV